MSTLKFYSKMDPLCDKYRDTILCAYSDCCWHFMLENQNDFCCQLTEGKLRANSCQYLWKLLMEENLEGDVVIPVLYRGHKGEVGRDISRKRKWEEI